jgi:AcrR family transcriptional regulator
MEQSVPKRRTKGPTAERYVEATLELIAESGSSTGINLREISRRIGCAHTNVYNYFASRDDLMWAALRKTLRLYAAAMKTGLTDDLSGHEWFRLLVSNLFEWSVQNPGLHRFLSSDPLDPEQIPTDIVDSASGIKRWLVESLTVLAGDRLSEHEVKDLVDIMLGYLDGETFNLINGRILPGEDIARRVLDNLERLFTLLTAKSTDGISLTVAHSKPGQLQFPKLEIST